MQTESKRLFTGLQPSGVLHIGNYFGALQPFIELYKEYESFLCVVDYHALTTIRDPEVLERNTLAIVSDYLASGVDPQKVTIFKQSDVSEHTELAWIFECLVTTSFLKQAHAYKDKVAKGLEATAGLFNYPLLMAADILLYDTDVVPVGEDQRQHIEYTREVASKFNTVYGDTFVMPQEKIQNHRAITPGIDGKKMSKSYKNTIPLFGSDEEVEKAVMGIVTDSEGERPENVHAIHRLFKSEDELATLYDQNKGNYQKLKRELLSDIQSFRASLCKRRSEIDDTAAREVLRDGALRAREIADRKMTVIRKKIGTSRTL